MSYYWPSGWSDLRARADGGYLDTHSNGSRLCHFFKCGKKARLIKFWVQGKRNFPASGSWCISHFTNE